ncbi:hypothetical protein AMECASPLE_004850, partial [Ameca splendens]
QNVLLSRMELAELYMFMCAFKPSTLTTVFASETLFLLLYASRFFPVVESNASPQFGWKKSCSVGLLFTHVLVCVCVCTCVLPGSVRGVQKPSYVSSVHSSLSF